MSFGGTDLEVTLTEKHVKVKERLDESRLTSACALTLKHCKGKLKVISLLSSFHQRRWKNSLTSTVPQYVHSSVIRTNLAEGFASLHVDVSK